MSVSATSGEPTDRASQLSFLDDGHRSPPRGNGLDTATIMDVAAAVVFDSEPIVEDDADDRQSDRTGSTSFASFANFSFGVVTPAKEYFSRVHLVGPPGSGKSSLRACLLQSIQVFSSLPDVSPSVGSTGTTYYFEAANSGSPAAGKRDTGKRDVRERLILELVDTGPQQLTGLASLWPAQTVFVLVVSLATVKQKKERTGLLSLKSINKVFIHSKDADAVIGGLREIALCAPGSAVALVGTHLDVLSDQDPEAVETILTEYRRLLTECLDDVSKQFASSPNPPLPLRLIGAFAVSCKTQICIPENRGGPKTLKAMWSTVCDTALKDARFVGLTGLLKTGCGHDSLVRSPIAVATLKDDDFLRKVGIVSKILRALRAEHGVALLTFHEVAQACFVADITLRPAVEATLMVLEHRGEVYSYRRGPGRSAFVLLVPHLPTKVLHAVTLAVQYARAPPLDMPATSAKKERKPFVAVDEVLSADATSGKELQKGIFHNNVVAALAATALGHVDSAVDRAWLFGTIGQLGDFLVRLPTSQMYSPSFPSDTGSFDSTVSAGGAAAPADSDTDSGRFVAPILLQNDVSPGGVASLRREVATGALHVLRRRLSVTFAPPALFPALLCRVCSPPAAKAQLYRNAGWVADAAGGVRCLILREGGDSALQANALGGPLSVELLFVGSTGADGARQLAVFVSEVCARMSALMAARRVAIFSITPLSPTPGSGDCGLQQLSVSEQLRIGKVGHGESRSTLLRLDLAMS